MEKEKVKKKVNVKAIIVLVLALYLIIMLIYYVITLPIKSIEINGNNLVNDQEIIEKAGINDYPILFKTNTSKIKKNINSLSFISSVSIKRNIFGKIKIDVVEEKVLLYNALNDTYALSNGEEVKSDTKISGLPILVNYVQSDIFKDFLKRFAKIDESIIKMISEIEYDPDISESVVIDDSRFLLRMNDGNSVYVNNVNLERLNRYAEILSTILDQGKGVLYLDSNSSNTLFKTYDKIEAEKVKEEVVPDELPE